jgi:hypothetical protein
MSVGRFQSPVDLLTETFFWMAFQYSNVLGVRDIVVSKQRRQLPQGHREEMIEMMSEAGRS